MYLLLLDLHYLFPCMEIYKQEECINHSWESYLICMFDCMYVLVYGLYKVSLNTTPFPIFFQLLIFLNLQNKRFSFVFSLLYIIDKMSNMKIRKMI